MPDLTYQEFLAFREFLTVPQQLELTRYLRNHARIRDADRARHRAEQYQASHAARLEHAARRGWKIRSVNGNTIALSEDPRDIRYGGSVALFYLMDRDGGSDGARKQKRQWNWVPWRHPGTWCQAGEILPAVLQRSSLNPEVDVLIHYVGVEGSLCGLSGRASWSVAGTQTAPIQGRSVCPTCAAASGKGVVP